MWSKHQEDYFKANAPWKTLIVGQEALVDNGLMYGPCMLTVHTCAKELDNLVLGDIVLEHYHFIDGYFCREIDKENRVWLPSAERALVDTITFIDKNYIEGALIESLQTYLSNHNDLSELRHVADFYKLPSETLDYWIKEARESRDMSI